MSTINTSHIVIIEDDEHIAAIFKLAFEKAGFEPSVLSSGRLAMEYLLDNTPDLILLDLHLPFVSGREILAYIRATARLAGTTTVIVSADQLEVDRLKREGVEALLKPIGFRQMYNFALQFKDTNTTDAPPSAGG